MESNTKFIEMRKRLGPSQAEFAAKIGVARSTIADIERGSIGVSKRVRSKIVEKFNKEVGVLDVIKLDNNVEIKGGVEVGLKEGFADFGMCEDDVKLLENQNRKRVKELIKKHTHFKQDNDTLKLFNKQILIAEKCINILTEESTNYQTFRKNIIAIRNFEYMINNLTDNDVIDQLISIREMAINYLDSENVSDMKAAIVKDFSKFEPHLQLFEDLAKAMLTFAEKAKVISKLTDIDMIEFNNYLELSL